MRVAIALAAVTFFVWCGWFFVMSERDSPEFTAEILAASIQGADPATVAKYVDVEGLTDGVAADIVTMLRNDLSISGGAEGNLADSLSGVSGRIVQDGIAEELRLRMYDWIRTGDWRIDQTQTPYTHIIFSLFDALAIDALSGQDISLRKSDEGSASFLVSLGGVMKGSGRHAILSLRDYGEYWRIAEIKNLPDILSDLQRRVSSLVEEHNENQQAAIAASALLTDPHVRVEYRGEDGFFLVSGYRLKNIGQKAISRMNLTVMVGDSTGNLLHTAFEEVVFASPLQPGDTTYRQPSGELDPVNDAHQRVIATANSGLTIVHHVTAMEYHDGTRIEYAEGYHDIQRTAAR